LASFTPMIVRAMLAPHVRRLIDFHEHILRFMNLLLWELACHAWRGVV
jgi:hypothetical protein